jgi:hypothetical protein
MSSRSRPSVNARRTTMVSSTLFPKYCFSLKRDCSMELTTLSGNGSGALRNTAEPEPSTAIRTGTGSSIYGAFKLVQSGATIRTWARLEREAMPQGRPALISSTGGSSTVSLAGSFDLLFRGTRNGRVRSVLTSDRVVAHTRIHIDRIYEFSTPTSYNAAL